MFTVTLQLSDDSASGNYHSFLSMAPLNGVLPEPSSWAGISLLSLGFVALLYVVEKLFFVQPLPKGVPFIREPPGATRFSLKTRWAYMTDCANLHKEAYEKVSLGLSSILAIFPLPEAALNNRGRWLTPDTSTWRKARPSSFLGWAFAKSSSCPRAPTNGSIAMTITN